MARKRAENREGALGYPGVVTPMFTKESKLRGKRKKMTRAPRDCDSRTHLKKVSPLRGPSSAKRWSNVFPGQHFPPYGTPHTANMRVGKPTLLVKNK
ncbi:hypothetical protein TNCV_2240211 [Trichonephila clavipes]|nr:hypothetical protein TNCV_2240211 [Trichonephila clavipes]